MSGLPRKKLFALVGESQKNADGVHRQALLQKALPGEKIQLVREAENPHDSNCVLAVDEEGRTIGSLSKDDAAVVAPLMDKGKMPSAFIHELSGGMPDDPSFGCVVSIVWEGRTKPEPRRLEAEQEFYEHAPIWEKVAARPIRPRKAKKGATGFLELFSRL